MWGVGPSHEIDLYLRAAPSAPVGLEFDVSAALLPERPAQEVTVLAGGHALTTWAFTAAANRGVRGVVVPTSAVAAGQWGAPVIRLAFRPASVVPVNRLNPARQDERALGLGLHALRRAVPT